MYMHKNNDRIWCQANKCPLYKRTDEKKTPEQNMRSSFDIFELFIYIALVKIMRIIAECILVKLHGHTLKYFSNS